MVDYPTALRLKKYNKKSAYYYLSKSEVREGKEKKAVIWCRPLKCVIEPTLEWDICLQWADKAPVVLNVPSTEATAKLQLLMSEQLALQKALNNEETKG